MQAGSPASPQARAALEALCSGYWYPLYAFIRRKGNDPVRALDLTLDFFARFFEKDILASVDQRMGRFRSFLRVACRNFLIDAWRHKADVATTPISIDARDAEGGYVVEPADNLTAERLFDRTWALTLLDRVMAILAAEYADSGRSALQSAQDRPDRGQGRRAVRRASRAARDVRGRHQHRQPPAAHALPRDSPGADRRHARRSVRARRRDPLAVRRHLPRISPSVKRFPVKFVRECAADRFRLGALTHGRSRTLPEMR